MVEGTIGQWKPGHPCYRRCELEVLYLVNKSDNAYKKFMTGGVRLIGHKSVAKEFFERSVVTYSRWVIFILTWQIGLPLGGRGSNLVSHAPSLRESGTLQ